MSTSAAATPVRRTQARADATRLALLDAALAEFAAHGFDGASTRSIAARAGTHQPQINYHFASKEALWKAAVDHLFERLDELLSAEGTPRSDAGESRASFAAGIRAFVRAAARLPELNRIMVMEATADSDRLAWIVERHTRHRYGWATTAWRQLADRGEVPDVDDTVIYYTMVGAASLAYVNAPEAAHLGHDTLADDFVERHANALVLMLLGPEPSPDA